MPHILLTANFAGYVIKLIGKWKMDILFEQKMHLAMLLKI